MPYFQMKLNEIEFNESYALAGFLDIKDLRSQLTTDDTFRKNTILSGDRHTIIKDCKRFRPKGSNKDDTINIIQIITNLSVKMNCRYDNIRCLALIRK